MPAAVAVQVHAGPQVVGTIGGLAARYVAVAIVVENGSSAKFLALPGTGDDAEAEGVAIIPLAPNRTLRYGLSQSR